MLKLKDLPKEERPRERLISNGCSALSNSEFLAIILGEGSKKENVLFLANRLLTKYNIKELSQASVSELKEIFGISDAKACAIISTFELGRRASAFKEEKTKINTVNDIIFMFPEMQHMKKEILKTILVDSKMNVICSETISLGSGNTNRIELKEVFAPAVARSASGMILIHNHPSGQTEPSKEDIKFTKNIAKTGAIMGIELLDHIIVGNGSYTSFRERGLF